MSYPQLDGKSDLAALVPLPARLPRGLNPSAAVLCYPRWLFRQLSQSEDATEYQWGYRGDVYCLASTANTVAVVGGLGVGAPAAVMLMEELGAQGVNDFIIIGAVGGLQAALTPGDTVVCDAALRDEGTSHHYLPPGRWARPNQGLTDHLDEQINRRATRTYRGATWTTDAPYRETADELHAYRSASILTVDMEAAGLFAAAQLRGYAAAAAFVVADLLTDAGWNGPGEIADTRASLTAAAASAVETLRLRNQTPEPTSLGTSE